MIKYPKTVGNLAFTMRKQGISHLKTPDGLEITISPEAFLCKRRRMPKQRTALGSAPEETISEDPIQSAGQMSEEDLLFWSSGQLPDESSEGVTNG